MSTAREVLSITTRQYRQELGLSQEQLAELSGLHRTYISSIERGARNVGVDNIERIARALGRSVADLFAENAGGHGV